ncbi:hypothetical protein MAXJ12_31552 [Mesorhizobium alhagi CCNWXJ12-2]|uniref:Uncharacterized protein n=1 Tax=Mesorhizobium alhagi CCNWXJ12-2 TaxID=1107882 RepID=H0I1H3_9HYPH|nr:hypothetical protein MAXJ12_31552 [Mesorhizobium alhagi CCNWXJ12-2]
MASSPRIAREAARLLEGSNWLPEPLREPNATRVADINGKEPADINDETIELPFCLAERAGAGQEIADAVE